MPRLQEAIHASQMAVPPQLVQDYIQIARVAGHPKDPPDFPGYNAAVADSIALVINVSSDVMPKMTILISFSPFIFDSLEIHKEGWI
ncbi:hypothetical protein ZWY2020_043710 [Hordeum vulgare]|nr:hypothetical protein ZWY2020_043710 [Hordeum vulgare]